MLGASDALDAGQKVHFSRGLSGGDASDRRVRQASRGSGHGGGPPAWRRQSVRPPPTNPNRKSRCGGLIKKGRKLAAPSEQIKTLKAVKDEVRWYGNSRRVVRHATGQALWHDKHHSAVTPIRWACVLGDPKRNQEEAYFFCSDTTATAVWIIEQYALRWNIEVTFEESRAASGPGKHAALVPTVGAARHPHPAGPVQRGDAAVEQSARGPSTRGVNGHAVLQQVECDVRRRSGGGAAGSVAKHPTATSRKTAMSHLSAGEA